MASIQHTHTHTRRTGRIWQADYFYVVQSGELNVFKDDKITGHLSAFDRTDAESSHRPAFEQVDLKIVRDHHSTV